MNPLDLQRQVIQPLAAQLQQRVALAVAQLLRADQAVVPVALAGDAVAGEHADHHPFPRIRRAMSCAGAGLRRPSSSMSTFWCGRVAAAANLALGVAVPPQSLCPDRGAMQEILFVDEEEEDGSYRASAVAAAIHTETGITGLETPPR